MGIWPDFVSVQSSLSPPPSSSLAVRNLQSIDVLAVIPIVECLLLYSTLFPPATVGGVQNRQNETRQLTKMDWQHLNIKLVQHILI